MSIIHSLACDQIALNATKYDIMYRTPYLVPVTLFFGGLAYYFLAQMIREHGVALSNGNWNVASTVLGTIIGYFLWNEHISQKQFVGIGIGIASLYLMDGV